MPRKQQHPWEELGAAIGAVDLSTARNRAAPAPYMSHQVQPVATRREEPLSTGSQGVAHPPPLFVESRNDFSPFVPTPGAAIQGRQLLQSQSSGWAGASSWTCGLCDNKCSGNDRSCEICHFRREDYAPPYSLTPSVPAPVPTPAPAPVRISRDHEGVTPYVEQPPPYLLEPKFVPPPPEPSKYPPPFNSWPQPLDDGKMSGVGGFNHSIPAAPRDLGLEGLVFSGAGGASFADPLGTFFPSKIADPTLPHVEKPRPVDIHVFNQVTSASLREEEIPFVSPIDRSSGVVTQAEAVPLHMKPPPVMPSKPLPPKGYRHVPPPPSSQAVPASQPRFRYVPPPPAQALPVSQPGEISNAGVGTTKTAPSNAPAREKLRTSKVDVHAVAEDVVVIPPGFWACQQCTYHNPEESSSCDICSFPRPRPSVSAGTPAPVSSGGEEKPKKSKKKEKAPATMPASGAAAAVAAPVVVVAAVEEPTASAVHNSSVKSQVKSEMKSSAAAPEIKIESASAAPNVPTAAPKVPKPPKEKVSKPKAWLCPQPNCGRSNSGDVCWNCHKHKDFVPAPAKAAQKEKSVPAAEPRASGAAPNWEAESAAGRAYMKAAFAAQAASDAKKKKSKVAAAARVKEAFVSISMPHFATVLRGRPFLLRQDAWVEHKLPSGVTVVGRLLGKSSCGAFYCLKNEITDSMWLLSIEKSSSLAEIVPAEPRDNRAFKSISDYGSSFQAVRRAWLINDVFYTVSGRRYFPTPRRLAAFVNSSRDLLLDCFDGVLRVGRVVEVQNAQSEAATLVVSQIQLWRGSFNCGHCSKKHDGYLQDEDFRPSFRVRVSLGSLQTGRYYS